MDKWVYVIIVFTTVGASLSACSSNPEPAEVTQVVEAESTVVLENSIESSAMPTDESTSMSDLPLPERSGLRIPAKTITFSGSCRSLRPDDADHQFRLMAITPERDNAGNKIIPLVVTCDQRRMNFSHRFSFQF